MEKNWSNIKSNNNGTKQRENKNKKAEKSPNISVFRINLFRINVKSSYIKKKAFIFCF